MQKEKVILPQELRKNLSAEGLCTTVHHPLRCFSEDVEKDVQVEFVEKIVIEDGGSTQHCTLDPQALPKIPPRRTQCVSLTFLYEFSIDLLFACLLDTYNNYAIVFISL